MRYAIIEHGIVTNVVIAGGPQGDNWVASDSAGPGWLYINGVFSEPPAPPAPPPMRKLTKLGFRRLFTETEKQWVDELEVTFEANAGLTVGQKRLLRTGFKDYNTATEIDLDDPAVADMLDTFVLLGGLTANRVEDILA